MWMRDESCREVIEDAWSFYCQGNPMKRVEGKVDSYHRNLKWWSKVAFGNVTSLREIKDQLRVAEEAALRGGRKKLGGVRHDCVLRTNRNNDNVTAKPWINLIAVWNELEKENKEFFEDYAKSQSKADCVSAEETTKLIQKIKSDASKDADD
ncbi:hypothetical protein CFP56_039015 [Quercus suber]|uniref:Uncharacterized protein n=1 Tax=Quercus suber TaxID=58331 RepID=A0AAW0J0E3_QUESU